MRLANLFEEILNETVFYHGSRRSEIDWNGRNEKSDYNMLGYGIYLTNNKQEAKYYATQRADKGYLHTYISDNAQLLNWFDVVPGWLRTNVLKDPNFFDLFTKNAEFDEYQAKLENGCLIEWDELEEDLPPWAIEHNYKPGWFVIKTCGGEEEITMNGLSKDQLINYINKLPTAVDGTVKVNDLEFYGTSNLGDEMGIKDIFKSLAHLYLYLYTKLGSTKMVTQYLVKCGVDGVTAEQDTSDVTLHNKPIVMVIYNPNKFKKQKMKTVSKTKQQ